MTTGTAINGAFPTDSAAAAALYAAAGYRPIPVKTCGKKAIGDDWQHLRLTEETVLGHFPASANVGVLNGEPSGNLADADLDCDEACAIAAVLLPQTGMVFGRASAPRSH